MDKRTTYFVMTLLAILSMKAHLCYAGQPWGEHGPCVVDNTKDFEATLVFTSGALFSKEGIWVQRDCAVGFIHGNEEYKIYAYDEEDNHCYTGFKNGVPIKLRKVSKIDGNTCTAIDGYSTIENCCQVKVEGSDSLWIADDVPSDNNFGGVDGMIVKKQIILKVPITLEEQIILDAKRYGKTNYFPTFEIEIIGAAESANRSPYARDHQPIKTVIDGSKLHDIKSAIIKKGYSTGDRLILSNLEFRNFSVPIVAASSNVTISNNTFINNTAEDSNITFIDLTSANNNTIIKNHFTGKGPFIKRAVSYNDNNVTFLNQFDMRYDRINSNTGEVASLTKVEFDKGPEGSISGGSGKGCPQALGTDECTRLFFNRAINTTSDYYPYLQPVIAAELFYNGQVVGIACSPIGKIVIGDMAFCKGIIEEESGSGNVVITLPYAATATCEASDFSEKVCRSVHADKIIFHTFRTHENADGQTSPALGPPISETSLDVSSKIDQETYAPLKEWSNKANKMAEKCNDASFENEISLNIKACYYICGKEKSDDKCLEKCETDSACAYWAKLGCGEMPEVWNKHCSSFKLDETTILTKNSGSDKYTEPAKQEEKPKTKPADKKEKPKTKSQGKVTPKRIDNEQEKCAGEGELFDVMLNKCVCDIDNGYIFNSNAAMISGMACFKPAEKSVPNPDPSPIPQDPPSITTSAGDGCGCDIKGAPLPQRATILLPYLLLLAVLRCHRYFLRIQK